MTVGATAAKRDKLAAQLTWLRQPRHSQSAGRPPPRSYRAAQPIAMLSFEDGTKMTCRIIDMSLSGAPSPRKTGRR